jgi:hypothetical protein
MLGVESINLRNSIQTIFSALAVRESPHEAFLEAISSTFGRNSGVHLVTA